MEKKNVKLKIGQVFNILKSIEDVMISDIHCPVSFAWKLSKTMSLLSEVVDYALSRIGKFMSGFGERELTENERLVYDEIMNSEVEIEIPCFSEDEFVKLSEKVLIHISSIDGLRELVDC